MLRIGVTGSPGAGKSEVSRRFASHGAEVLEADILAHGLYEPGGPAYAPLVAAFGSDIISSDGFVDRGVLRRKLLESPSALAQLNSLVHPPLLDLLRRKLADAQGGRSDDGRKAVVVDAALLLEWGIQDDFDALVVVDAPKELRLSRLKKRPGWSSDLFNLISAGQIPPEEKRSRANYVIENTGSLEEVHRRADQIWEDILRHSPPS